MHNGKGPREAGPIALRGSWSSGTPSGTGGVPGSGEVGVGLDSMVFMIRLLFLIGNGSDMV